MTNIRELVLFVSLESSALDPGLFFDASTCHIDSGHKCDVNLLWLVSLPFDLFYDVGIPSQPYDNEATVQHSKILVQIGRRLFVSLT